MMDQLPVHAVDLIIIGIITLSALLAFSRGFTREIFSIIGWIAAALATFYGIDSLKPYTRQLIGLEIIADIVAGGVIFITTLIIVSLLSRALAQGLRGSALGPLDRSLGFLFGGVRGVVVVCLAYLLFLWLHEDETEPQWLQEARLRPVLQQGTDWLIDWMPGHTDSRPQPPSLLTKPAENIPAKSSLVPDPKAAQKQQEVERLSNPRPVAGKTAEDIGYSQQERQEMDRLHNRLEGD